MRVLYPHANVRQNICKRTMLPGNATIEVFLFTVEVEDIYDSPNVFNHRCGQRKSYFHMVTTFVETLFSATHESVLNIPFSVLEVIQASPLCCRGRPLLCCLEHQNLLSECVSWLDSITGIKLSMWNFRIKLSMCYPIVCGISRKSQCVIVTAWDCRL